MPTSYIIINIVIGLLEGVALAFSFIQLVIAYVRFADMLHVKLFSKGFFTALRGRLKRFRPIWFLQAIMPVVVVFIFVPTGSLFHHEQAAGFDAPGLARVGISTMFITLFASISYIGQSPQRAKKIDIGEWSRAKPLE